ncbi:hypothetical protein ANN_19408 [Periplaneta americana]|uniref:DUF7869 domain-containing protein n=1 Tax=Periplaneta americana TaxID=6978 RepID=A0ABQ8SA42_PERAM|nr:hypothetical protein ANN_19408 [Periplaneta americana]
MRLELHHRKAQKAQDLLKADTSASQLPNCRTCCISMYLQQVMFVPTLTHSEIFYRRQLSCYNFGISVGDILQSYMCMWEEHIGGRGGNEIASCLLKVLNMGITEKKRLIIWSDKCAGQNKNRVTVFMCLFLVAVGLFEYIEQRFLVSGHSFLPCDSDFALIERRKKVTKVYIPSELQQIVQEAKMVKPFQVVSMQSMDFLNIQTVADNIICTKALNISKEVCISIDCSDLNSITVKETHSDMDIGKKDKVLKKGKSMKDITSALFEAILQSPQFRKSN